MHLNKLNQRTLEIALNLTQIEIKAGHMSKWHQEKPLQEPCCQLLKGFQTYLPCELPQEHSHTPVLPLENAQHNANIHHMKRRHFLRKEHQ